MRCSIYRLTANTSRTIEGFGLPANLDTWQDLMVVPELYGRVTILDRENRVAAHLGDDSQRIRADKDFAIRGDPQQWNPGRFVHPHDASFDRDGNLYVAEWVATGRESPSSGGSHSPSEASLFAPPRLCVR